MSDLQMKEALKLASIKSRSKKALVQPEGTKKKQPLVQVEDLLHELIGGKGHGLGGDTADVVERKASVQSFLHPKRIIHVL